MKPNFDNAFFASSSHVLEYSSTIRRIRCDSPVGPNELSLIESICVFPKAGHVKGAIIHSQDKWNKELEELENQLVALGYCRKEDTSLPDVVLDSMQKKPYQHVGYEYCVSTQVMDASANPNNLAIFERETVFANKFNYSRILAALQAVYKAFLAKVPAVNLVSVLLSAGLTPLDISDIFDLNEENVEKIANNILNDNNFKNKDEKDAFMDKMEENKKDVLKASQNYGIEITDEAKEEMKKKIQHVDNLTSKLKDCLHDIFENNPEFLNDEDDDEEEEYNEDE